MSLVAEIPHEEYGSAIFVRNNCICDSTSTLNTDNVEIIQAQLNKLTMTSVYKPPNEQFSFGGNLASTQMNVVIGDFNSHGVEWGYRSTFQAQSLSSSQTTSRDAKPTQHIEITHPNNVNLKLAFHKVASFHPHYSTFTPQTYHHPVHRFRSWPMQMTSQSHPHTQVRVQPRNTYNHTYTKFLPGQNKTTSY